MSTTTITVWRLFKCEKATDKVWGCLPRLSPS
jgi:hypothetical protein